MPISLNAFAVSAFVAIGVVAASAPSSAAEFLLKANSGRCMHADTGDEIRTVATDTCGNGLGFIAINLSGGFANTTVGFRKMPAPAQTFVCLQAELPPPAEIENVRFPVRVITNNCVAPLTHWSIGTGISVTGLPDGVTIAICLEETPEHKVVGNRCNASSDAQKWATADVPQR